MFVGNVDYRQREKVRKIVFRIVFLFYNVKAGFFRVGVWD